MRRRDVVRRIGAATMLTVGGTGLASADGSQRVTWEFADGHTEEFTPQEFVDHPETPGVEALRNDGQLAALCCCCYDVDGCVDCGWRCPC